MSKYKSNIGHAMATNNNREVAAMITFVKTPEIKREFNSGSGFLDSLLNTIQNAPGLIVRRPWFGFDQMAADDFNERVPRTTFDPEELKAAFENIMKRSARGVLASSEEPEDIIQAELKSSKTTLADIDLKEAKDPSEKIMIEVPFVKLQRFLTRAYKITEESGTAQMTHVRVASAPRFDNTQPHLKSLLSYE